jgi:hypothetical protein
VGALRDEFVDALAKNYAGVSGDEGKAARAMLAALNAKEAPHA